ncbi:MAG: polyribonucleotide nucleotidyltransferase, partial [Tissierellia bacterium]|nr:polyribonucleotide nucleotidyltransferase [Tissierellia bacterium]
MEKLFHYDFGGVPLTVSIGKVAEQAGGACLVTYGETVILVTATASAKPREGIDFFPLSVDYVEKSYSVGKIPGGFIKREGRPSDKSVLNSRLIDRPLRPLFPEGYRNDVQIIATALSVDPTTLPEIIAMIGSSIALSISDIPFNGPTGSVNVGFIDGEYVLNPTSEQREKSTINLTVAGTEEAIMMVEAGAEFVSESEMLGAIMFGHEEIKKICAFIKTIQEEVGKEKQEVVVHEIEADLASEVEAFGSKLILDAMNNADKMVRQKLSDEAVAEIKEHFAEIYPDNKSDIAQIIDNIVSKEFRRQVLYDKIRPDGRAFDEVRKITSEVGLLPRTHGSGLFTRGQTQVMTLLTLGSMSDVQVIDDLGEEDSKRYIHHYNFPPFSVGDTRPVRG